MRIECCIFIRVAFFFGWVFTRIGDLRSGWLCVGKGDDIGIYIFTSCLGSGGIEGGGLELQHVKLMVVIVMCVCGWCIFSISYIVRDSSRLGSRSNIERDRVESSSGALQRDAFKLFRSIEIVKYIYIFVYVYTTNKPNTF